MRVRKVFLTPNIEELKQTPEDMYVEHNSSGSDNDNISESSLTVEDGTKDLTKNKGNFVLAIALLSIYELLYVKYRKSLCRNPHFVVTPTLS